MDPLMSSVSPLFVPTDPTDGLTNVVIKFALGYSLAVHKYFSDKGLAPKIEGSVVSPLGMQVHTNHSELLSCYQELMLDIQGSWHIESN